MAEYYFITRLYHLLCITSPTLLKDIWVVSSFGAIRNNAAMTIHVQVFIRTTVFISFGYMPGSEIAGAYGNSV